MTGGGTVHSYNGLLYYLDGSCINCIAADGIAHANAMLCAERFVAKYAGKTVKLGDGLVVIGVTDITQETIARIEGEWARVRKERR